MRYWNLIVTALLLSSNFAFGQYLENYEKRALTAFHSKDYAAALLFSEKVLEIDTANISSLFVAGEAARLSGDLYKAENFLSKIPNEAKVGYYAVTDFQLASVKLDLNKILEARAYYQKYFEEHNEANNLFAYLSIEAIKDIDRQTAKTKDSGVNMKKLADNINDPAPQYAPLRYADKIYFTSIVEVEDAKNRRKVHQVGRIMEANKHYPAKEFEGNPQNKQLSAGNISLTPDASRAYYTICKGDFGSNEGCEIWFRERQYEGGWGPPKRLPEWVNARGFTTTQPTIAWDKSKKLYILYFASDRPGGRGGLDIWASEMNRDGNFGQAYNLPFNTPQDDITPFFHQATQTLFFSSNGWPGKGGFDIYREARTSDGEWKVPENLGDMLNSSYDDTYYSFHSQSQNAYLVSNRPGSNCTGDTPLPECLDIYEARVFAEVNLKVFRSLDNTPIYAPQVEIREVGTEEAGAFAARNDQNQVPVRLETGKRYEITILADGFEPYKFEFSTEDISYFIELDRQIFLKRPLDP